MRNGGLAWLIALCACATPSGRSAACGEINGGSYVGEMWGAATGTLRGCARYGLVSGGGESLMAVVAQVGSPGSPVTQIRLQRPGPRAGVGTYTIGFGGGSFAGTVLVTPARIFNLTKGTVTIAGTAANELRGSFSVDGTQSASNGTIRVTGTFTAVCTPQPNITC